MISLSYCTYYSVLSFVGLFNNSHGYTVIIIFDLIYSNLGKNPMNNGKENNLPPIKTIFRLGQCLRYSIIPTLVSE